VTVNVQDTTLTGSTPVTAPFTLSVTDVNEAPTAVTLSVSSIAENSPLGTTVGRLEAVDPDASDSFTYEFAEGVGGTDNALFTIDGNALKTATAINFELRSTYSIRVRARDAAGAPTEKSFTLNVSDVVNEVLKVERITPPTPGAYKAGQSLRFSVDLSETVQVGGRPQIQLQRGPSTLVANYVGGTGSARLIFQYVVAPSDNATVVGLGARFVFPPNAFIAAGAERLAAALPVGIAGSTSPGVRLDSRAPAAAVVTRPLSGTYRIGQSLDFVVRFSEPVFVTGSPRIGLSGLTLPRQATYVSGSGTTSLTFRYVVQPNDALKPKQTLALGKAIGLPAGSAIADQAGNEALLAIAPPALNGLQVNGTVNSTLSTVRALAFAALR
jgi:hypothetical protein